MLRYLKLTTLFVVAVALFMVVATNSLLVETQQPVRPFMMLTAVPATAWMEIHQWKLWVYQASLKVRDLTSHLQRDMSQSVRARNQRQEWSTTNASVLRYVE